MLHEATVLNDSECSESSDVKDSDDNYEEQGYLWLCAACDDQPTFETIYDLFRHKKTHNIALHKKEENDHFTNVPTSILNSPGKNCIESSNSLKSFPKNIDDLDENATEIHHSYSPTPSWSSEDIPLASLLTDNSKEENICSKPKKRFKRITRKTKNKTSVKVKNFESKVVNDVQKTENKVSINSSINAEKSGLDETSVDLQDSKEEKENQAADDIDYFPDNDKKIENTENSKENKNSSSTKSKIKHICKICYTEFQSRFDLSVHKKTHLFENTGCYKCETCGRLCPKYDNFTRHLTIHFTNRQKNHQCTQCFASFYNYADLKRHLILHSDVKPYKCKHCDEGFIRLDNLLIHEYKHTGVQYKKFACKDCDKILNSPSALVMHAKTHSERTVFCPEPGCNFSCYLQSQLRQHTRKHSGEKPFQCAKCGRCFARSNDMKNHVLNVHEGIKPFKCSSCPKKFALQGNLNNHKITHTNERPFLCAQCGKSFNQSSTLRKHSMIMHNPCRVNGKQKKSKKMLFENSNRRSEDSKTNNRKPKTLHDSHMKEVKYKVERSVEPELAPAVKNDKAVFLIPNTANITTVTPAIIQEIPREAQIEVPQITVSLPIQVNPTQTFLLPAVILERCLIRTDNYIKNPS